jgi:hypothetical protein
LASISGVISTLATGSDLAGGDEGVEPGAGADVDYVLTGCQRAQRERVAHPGEGFHGPVGQRANHAVAVAKAARQFAAGVEVVARAGGDSYFAVLITNLVAQRIRVDRQITGHGSPPSPPPEGQADSLPFS